MSYGSRETNFKWRLFVFQVLNLFLAMLLNSFASDSIQRNKETKGDDDKMKKGWKRLKGLFKRSSVEPQEEEQVEKKPSIANIILALKEKKALESVNEDEKENNGGDKENTGEEKENKEGGKEKLPNGEVSNNKPDENTAANGSAQAGKNTAKVAKKSHILPIILILTY